MWDNTSLINTKRVSIRIFVKSPFYFSFMRFHLVEEILIFENVSIMTNLYWFMIFWMKKRKIWINLNVIGSFRIGGHVVKLNIVYYFLFWSLIVCKYVISFSQELCGLKLGNKQKVWKIWFKTKSALSKKKILVPKLWSCFLIYSFQVFTS